MSLEIGGTHASDFFIVRFYKRLARLPTVPTVLDLLCAEKLDSLLAGLVPLQRVDLGISVEMSAAGIKPAKAVCILETRGAEFGVVVFFVVSHNQIHLQPYRLIMRLGELLPICKVDGD